MKLLDQMTDAEVRQTVTTLARGIAAQRYRQRHPGCTHDAAWTHAHYRWHEYVDEAMDCLALLQVSKEDLAAAAELN